MSQERWLRRGNAASSDGARLARELDIPPELARALYVRASRNVSDEAEAERLCLRYLQEAAARRSAASPRPVPGRRTRAMGEGSSPLHEVAYLGQLGGLAPGRLTRVQLEQGDGDARRPRADEVPLAQRGSTGVALPVDVATRLAPHVGKDVVRAARLHIDDAADQIAADHHARAITIGDDIYFAHGEYAPGTERGDELLIHELTHVAQARRGQLTRAAAKGLDGGGALDPAEAEADLRVRLAVIELHAPTTAAPPLAAPSPQPTSGTERQTRLAAQQQRLGLVDQPAAALTVPPAPPATRPQPPVPHPAPQMTPPTPAGGAATGNAYVDTFQAPPSKQATELWAKAGAQAQAQVTAEQARFDAGLAPMPVVLDGRAPPGSPTGARAAHTPGRPPAKGQPPPAAQSTPTPPAPAVTAATKAAQGIQPTADKAQLKTDGQKVIDALPTTPPDVKTDPGPAPVTDLAGQADPVRSLGDRQHAITEGAKALDAAKTKVITGPGVAQIQPAKLDDKLKVPAPQPTGAMPPLPPVEGMTKLRQWNLPSNALAAFDTVARPRMDAGLAQAKARMTEADTKRDADRAKAVSDAQDKVKTAHTDADKQQQAKVADTRTQISNHQADTLVKHEAEIKKLDQQSGDRKKLTLGKIHDRITADQAKAQADYQAAQKQAEAKKQQGEVEAQKKKAEAQQKQKDDSWWDQATEAICDGIKAIADEIDKALAAIGTAIGQILDAVKDAACQAIDAARDFVCHELDELGSWLKSAVDALIGSVFPELAAALDRLIDQAVTLAKAAVKLIADGLKQAVTALCDGLKAALDGVLAAFRAAVQAAATFAQAVVTGNWALVGKMILDGILNALGIDPAAFYALIGEAQDSIEKIVQNPGAFVGHLIDAVKLGFKQFGANFWTHLKDGLVQWLFGTFASAGITMPASFDIAGIFDLVCQVLGLTWPRLRGKVVKIIGEKNTERLEFVAQYVQALITGGFAGLWAKIQGDLSNLWDMVVGGIRDWLIQAVVMAAIEKIATMWNPAGAIFELIKTAWNVYQWVRENAQRIFGLVQAVVHSISNIVAGNIGGAANFIEASLARLVPIAISLFADLLGLGGLADKIREIIEKVQEKVDHAIDKLIERVMGMFKGKGSGRRASPAGPPDAGPAGNTAPDEGDVEVPRALVASDRPQLESLTPSAAEEVDALKGRSVIYDRGVDPKTATMALLAAHPEARYDRASRRLTLPPVSPRSLEHAASLAEIGQRIAAETGVTRVIAERAATGLSLLGEINPIEELSFASQSKWNKRLQHVFQIRLWGDGNPIGGDGEVMSQFKLAGTMQQILIDARSMQHPGLTHLSQADDLKKKGNLAIGNIQVVGLTASGIQLVFTRPVQIDDPGSAHAVFTSNHLQIFSSGDGEHDGEVTKYPLVDYNGTTLRSATPAPGLAKIQIVSIGRAGVGTGVTDYEDLLKLIGVIASSTGKISPTNHKHSEQAIFMAVRRSDASIAQWIQDRQLDTIVRFVVQIHSEREMCRNCALAMNLLMEHMYYLAPLTWSALHSRRPPDASRVNTLTLTTATVPFGTAAAPVVHGPHSVLFGGTSGSANAHPGPVGGTTANIPGFLRQERAYRVYER